ncbi:MAG: polysaccharide biosynthesis/export family protein [Opitutae bacterium]|nr:polysaccharide biosynthesis/export family protein [Opitutae bacterium]
MNSIQTLVCRLLLFCLGSTLSLFAEETKPVSTDYVLQPSDLIRVLVFQEPDLQRDVRLTQEGSVSLPLIGTIELQGKSVHQAEDIIRQLYDRDYLVNPQISITVVEYAQRTAQVLGAVNSPGAIAFPPEQKMGLLEAIARAGGFSRLAERRRVRLTRTLADGKSENYTINADELIQGNSNEPWLLVKGDVIYVPERLL